MTDAGQDFPRDRENGIMHMQHRLRIAAAIISAAVLTGTLILLLWLNGFFLPSWIEWNKDCEDVIPEGVSEMLGSSWLVQDALIFDINGDEADECILLVWKRGSFGPHRPTWVQHDEIGFSQHIFIYSDRSGADDSEEDWHALWMSSKLGLKAADFSEGDEISGTGRHSLDIIAPDGTVTRWGWLSWGLTRVE